MRHRAGAVAARFDVPKLLQAYGVVLGGGLGVQIELADELLAQVPAAAFREQGVAG